jgi:DNA-binding CsgD family transcriptional regulator
MKKDNIENYSFLIKKIWSQNTDNPSNSYKKSFNFLKLKNLIDTISIGNYFSYIVNLHTGTFEYISPKIKDILGYSVDEFNLELYINLIHPDDMPHLVEIQKKVSEFTINNELNERMEYKYCYDYRVKDKNGEYHQLYIQHFYPELSENYNPQRAFSLLTDISHIKIGGIPKLNIFKLGDGLVKILNDKKAHKIQLTNKENEIFQYLIKGFTSQDISEALGLSKHTVNTHRRNILKRNNCYNTSELLSLYFETKIEST